MRSRAVTATLACAAVLLAATVARGEFLVVVNKGNEVVEISKSDLKRIFLGKLKEIGGEQVVATNQPLDSDIAREFLKDILGMTPEEYKEYWLEQQVKAGGTAPRIMRTDDNVSSFVGELPGGVGYIAKVKEGSNVKVVPVK